MTPSGADDLASSPSRAEHTRALDLWRRCPDERRAYDWRRCQRPAAQRATSGALRARGALRGPHVRRAEGHRLRGVPPGAGRRRVAGGSVQEAQEGLKEFVKYDMDFDGGDSALLLL